MPRGKEKHEFITYSGIRLERTLYERIKDIVEYKKQIDPTLTIHRYIVDAVRTVVFNDWMNLQDKIDEYKRKTQVVGGTSE